MTKFFTTSLFADGGSLDSQTTASQYIGNLLEAAPNLYPRARVANFSDSKMATLQVPSAKVSYHKGNLQGRVDSTQEPIPVESSSSESEGPVPVLGERRKLARRDVNRTRSLRTDRDTTASGRLIGTWIHLRVAYTRTRASSSLTDHDHVSR